MHTFLDERPRVFDDPAPRRPYRGGGPRRKALRCRTCRRHLQHKPLVGTWECPRRASHPGGTVVYIPIEELAAASADISAYARRLASGPRR